MFVLVHGATIGWVLLGCIIVLALFVRRSSPWKVRIRNAALAGIAAPVVSYLLARGLLLATSPNSAGTLAWTAAEIAAVSPARARGLQRARRVLVARILRGVPDKPFDAVGSALLTAGPAVDHESIRRYLELSTSVEDCRDATQFLTNVAVVAPDAAMPATDAAVSCGLKLQVASVAQTRTLASDFESASRIYDRASLKWTAHDPDDEFAARLLDARFRDEALTHLLAGNLPRADKTLERYQIVGDASRAPRVECARWAIQAIGGDANARAKLEKAPDIACAFELASLTPRTDRAALVKRLSHDPFGVGAFYLILAWDADDALDSSTTWTAADLATRSFRVQTPDEPLVFPYGARVEAPAVLLETLARLNALTSPAPPLRLARARYRAVAARFESSLGNDDDARRHIEDALADYRVLMEVDAKALHEVAMLRVESVNTTALGASIDLIAGDVDGADARIQALSTWVAAPAKDDVALAFEERDARASIHAIEAYIALFRGRTDAIERFVTSDDCKTLTHCSVLQTGLEALRKAARGDATGCEDVQCLVAARQPAARATLLERVDTDIELMSVERRPLERLRAVGVARRLALAIGDARYDAAFAGWLANLRPRALDARLASLTRELGEYELYR